MQRTSEYVYACAQLTHVWSAGAGCLLLMMGFLILVRRLRRSRRPQTPPMHPHLLPIFRGMQDALTLSTSHMDERSANMQPPEKLSPSPKQHPGGSNTRSRGGTQQPPEAPHPDNIPEIIVLESVASARQTDPEGLMDASHDSDPGSQVRTPVEWLLRSGPMMFSDLVRDNG